MNLLLIILSSIVFIDKLNAQILNGLEVASDDYRYQVLIFTDDQICSGAIIDESYILTAAHCFDIGHLEKVFVIAGMNVLNDTTKVVRAVSEIHIHPDYMSGLISGTEESMTHRPQKMGNDIAVIKLYVALELGDRITKIELPTSNIPYCHVCFLAGWGPYKKEEDNMLSNVLRWTTMTIGTSQFCTTVGVIHAANEFCAYDPFEMSTAIRGDSGGPLKCAGKLTGIVSTGWEKLEVPIIFTNVYEHLDFIKGIMIKF